MATRIDASSLCAGAMMVIGGVIGVSLNQFSRWLSSLRWCLALVFSAMINIAR